MPLLAQYRQRDDTVVLGLARGGVAVGLALAEGLNLPLGVLVVRKLGYPGNPEFAVGAVDADGEYVLGEEFRQSGLDQTPAFQRVLQQELLELHRRVKLFNPIPLAIEGKIVIVADDGIATGQTDLSAINYLKRHGAKEVVAAAPVASLEAVELLKSTGARVVVLTTPANFMAVGQFYEYFPQITDEEVLAIINLHNRKDQ